MKALIQSVVVSSRTGHKTKVLRGKCKLDPFWGLWRCLGIWGNVQILTHDSGCKKASPTQQSDSASSISLERFVQNVQIFPVIAACNCDKNHLESYSRHLMSLQMSSRWTWKHFMWRLKGTLCVCVTRHEAWRYAGVWAEDENDLISPFVERCLVLNRWWKSATGLPELFVHWKQLLVLQDLCERELKQ